MEWEKKRTANKIIAEIIQETAHEDTDWIAVCQSADILKSLAKRANREKLLKMREKNGTINQR